MALETYLVSDEFFLFQDQELRRTACMAVESFLDKSESVDKSQLHSIPSAIQAGGYEALRKLVQQQRDKNSKEKNKVFWNYIFEHVFNPSAGKESFPIILRENLEKAGYIKDENKDDRKLRNQIKKENKNTMNQAMETVLFTYFQHFNCHYFYTIKQR